MLLDLKMYYNNKLAIYYSKMIKVVLLVLFLGQISCFFSSITDAVSGAVNTVTDGVSSGVDATTGAVSSATDTVADLANKIN